MTLSADQRAEINRKNAQLSTGPRTERGKSISRGNALRHGLRADALPMPGEDPGHAAQRSADWNDFYRPRSPAAQHLVNECIRATLLADRVAAAQAATAAEQFRKVGDERDVASRQEIDEQLARLQEQTLDAIAQLRAFPAGCRWLIAFWARLDGALKGAGVLDFRDIEIGYYLLGRRNPNARDFQRFAQSLLPDYPLDPRCPDLATARARLDAIIAAALASHHDAAAQLTDSADSRALAAHTALCLIPDDASTARLLLRYQAEARTSFHRALNALVSTLKRDAEDGAEWRQEQDEGQESPNEADSPGEVGSPSEAKPAAAGSPNEADSPTVFLSRGPKSDPTVRDEWGRPTNMVNMCMVPVS